MEKILIQGGTVISMEPGQSDGSIKNVLIENGQILDVGDIAPSEHSEVIDAAGCIVLPGLIDSHVHTWQTGLRGIAGDWTVPQYMRAMHRG